MRSPSHSSPGRRRAWRVATPVVVLLSGALFAVSAEQSDGFDLRGGRLTDLASVVRAERDEAGELTARGRLAQRRGGVAQHAARRPVGRAGAGRDRHPRRPGGADREDRPGRAGHPRRRLRGVAPGLRGRPQRPGRAPAGHPGRGQRHVERRCRGGHDPGAAADLHDRHQVRGQPGHPPRHPLLAALRDRGHRRPGRDGGRAHHRPDPRDLPRLHPRARWRRLVGHDPSRLGRRAAVRGSARPHLRDPDPG